MTAEFGHDGIFKIPRLSHCFEFVFIVRNSTAYPVIATGEDWLQKKCDFIATIFIFIKHTRREEF